MTFRFVPLGLLVKLEPERAARQIRDAVERAGANIAAAADALDVTERTLHRYIGDLGLRDELEAMRLKASEEGRRHHRRKE